MKRNIAIILIAIAIQPCFAEKQLPQKPKDRDESLVYCIAPPANNTGDTRFEPLAEGFADVLISACSNEKEIRIVEREKLSQLMNELKLSLRALTKQENAVKVGRLLRADRIIIGGIIKPKDKLIVNLHVYEIKTARLVTSVQAQSTEDDIFALSTALIDRLGKGLSIRLKPITPDRTDDNPQASLSFIRGLGYYYSGDFDRAVISFMKAVNSRADYVNASLWTAKSFIEVREYGHAVVELQHIVDNNPDTKIGADALKLLKMCRNK